MNKNFTKKIVSVASAVAIMGAVAVPAMAATPATGTTTVFYSSENFIPGPDGAQWGVKIPSGIALSNAQTTVGGDKAHGVELVSTVPGKALNVIYQKLEVNATVKSENGYKLLNDAKDESKAATYKYQLGGKTFEIKNTVQDAEKPLTLAEPSQNGTFTLTKGSVEKGNYTDTLTFSFTQQAAELNPNNK